MRTAAYIGGIGGFAIALGVGAAVAGGCGAASADSADSGPGPRSSATHSPSTARSAVGHAQRAKPKTPAPRQKALSTKPAASATTTATAAVTSSPVTTKVGWVTGPNTATPGRFGIYGTDVGIMWDNGMAGDKRQVLMIFGDTFSGPGMSGNWRSNVLLRTNDPINRNFEPGSTTDPFAGSPLASPGMSKQVIAGSARNLGPFGSQVTVIPTAAISVPYDNAYGARQYVNFMSVRSWDFGGAWTTNYSALAYSDDNGQNWTVAPETIRAASWLRSSTPFVYGNQNFQQGAFVKPPADSPDAGYVFSYGTPSGRLGSAYLSRVKETDILDLAKYEYWDGDTWVAGKPGAAVPILPTTRSNQYAGGFLGQLGLFFGSWVAGIFGVGGPSGHVSELSVQYNTYLNKYVAMYSSSVGSVIIRTADTPQGAWSAPTTLVTSVQYPGLYAPMMDPWSTGQDIYWNLSIWGSYNVLLMKTTLGQAAVQA